MKLKRDRLLEEWMKYLSRHLTPARDEKEGLTDGHGLIHLLNTKDSIELLIVIKVNTIFTYYNDVDF